jgi:hypothetical protein
VSRYAVGEHVADAAGWVEHVIAMQKEYMDPRP